MTTQSPLQSPQQSPLWPARLHHIQIGTPQPAAMAAFYQRTFGYQATLLADGRTHLRGGERRLLIAEGAARSVGFGAYALATPRQLAALRGHLEERGIAPQPSPTPLFTAAAFAVRDPDGRQIVFGLPAEDGRAADALPGRLQHLVVTTVDLPRSAAFYEDVLGFVVSDRVVNDEGVMTTCFFRSDPEHHSFAAFLATEARLDHHALEVPCWNDIRDWADHCAALDVPITWGPGRHGPGNNLFFMVSDPDGNMVEISSELEHMPREMAARQWPHTARSLNLWGSAIMRI